MHVWPSLYGSYASFRPTLASVEIWSIVQTDPNLVLSRAPKHYEPVQTAAL